MANGKFSELTESDVSYIRAVHSDNTISWDERMSILRNKFDIAERTARRWIKRLGFSQLSHIESDQFREAKLKTFDSSKKRFIITWAQNATAVHLSFWKNILSYSKFIDASVHVIAGRYLNPSLYKLQKGLNEYEWWDSEIRPYLDAGRHQIHPFVTVLSDIKIQPTASNPLSGFEGISKGNTSIIGHPKVHLDSLPVLEGHNNKLLMTTGACTIRNYSDTKAGKQGEFHHCFGFVIVEIKDDLTYFVRQVTANNEGSFIDLFWKVEGEEVTRIKECSAFVMGDLHWKQLHIPVFKKSLEYFKKVAPKRVVLHDIFDGKSISHHEMKDPIKRFFKYQKNDHLLAKEIEECVDGISSLAEYNPIVVWSNHNIWVDKYILDQDWKKDIPNALTYMQYAQVLLEGKAPKGIVAYKLEEKYGDNIICLDADDSFKINSWEVASHGHLGANGGKGNIETYRKLSTKIITGDSHVPRRKDNAISVGTYTKLRLEYNKGASSWMWAGAIIHEDSKAQHVIFFEGEDGEVDFTTLWTML